MWLDRTLETKDLHAWYGASHILHGISSLGGAGRGGVPWSAATVPARPPP